jgi:hypothetical protein
MCSGLRNLQPRCGGCSGINLARKGGPANKDDNCHVEPKNPAVVRTHVGYHHRYDTAGELLLLNEIWQPQSKLISYPYPHRNEIGDSAMVSRKYDTTATPFHGMMDHPTITERVADLAIVHGRIDPPPRSAELGA